MCLIHPPYLLCQSEGRVAQAVHGRLAEDAAASRLFPARGLSHGLGLELLRVAVGGEPLTVDLPRDLSGLALADVGPAAEALVSGDVELAEGSVPGLGVLHDLVPLREHALGLEVRRSHLGSNLLALAVEVHVAAAVALIAGCVDLPKGSVVGRALIAHALALTLLKACVIILIGLVVKDTLHGSLVHMELLASILLTVHIRELSRNGVYLANKDC